MQNLMKRRKFLSPNIPEQLATWLDDELMSNNAANGRTGSVLSLT